MDRTQRPLLAVGTVILGVLPDLALADDTDDCSLGKKIPVFGCTPNVLGMVAACLFVLLLLIIGCCFYRGCDRKNKKKQVPTVTGGLSSDQPATTETFPMAPPPYSQSDQPYAGAQVYFVRPYPGAENPPQPAPGGQATWTEPPPPYTTDTKVPL
ncbi:PREDICTED: uncharacterized protein LOC109486479 [Branchiostoma belcheri]|uniref:Uncharacterized protein LOC109486479 n=1 Tax=Branchiostoma belcheri TaxID=7741 RepID=A0A6P5AHS7_BRABE|nr:PREDICTED: uncharacterized protein LOC109486479 [Branchiostoma belcheri]